MRNLITDVPGILVGNVHDEKIWTGVTCVVPDGLAVTGADVRGGGAGTREMDVMRPTSLVDGVHAVVLSGGSAFGLDAASGAMDWLREKGRGFAIADKIVPIVPSAILFDLLNGGDKEWGDQAPYRAMGRQAMEAAGAEFSLGNVGAGYGACAGGLKGGLGSASCVAGNGAIVGALVAVNPSGETVMPGSDVFFAHLHERDGEFGGRHDYSGPVPVVVDVSSHLMTNTTLAVVATDMILSKGQAERVAIMAHDGFARAINPVHTPFDGDVVFVMSTGRVAMSDPAADVARLGIAAADCVARSVARGVYEAETLGDFVSYRDRFGV